MGGSGLGGSLGNCPGTDGGKILEVLLVPQTHNAHLKVFVIDMTYIRYIHTHIYESEQNVLSSEFTSRKKSHTEKGGRSCRPEPPFWGRNRAKGTAKISQNVL